MSIKNDHHHGSATSDNSHDLFDSSSGLPESDVLALTAQTPAPDGNEFLTGTAVGQVSGPTLPTSSEIAQATSLDALPVGLSPASVSQPIDAVFVTAANSNLSWNLEFVAADNPTQAFEAGIEQAASLLSAAISVPSPITINIRVGYNETDGNPLAPGSASAGPSSGIFEPYTTVRNDLLNDSPGDPNFNSSSLPSGTSIQGQSSVIVWSAQEKVFGLLAGNATGQDGTSGFSSSIPSNLLVGVGIHELSHALGRIPSSSPDIFDLFRFTSAGTRLFEFSIPATSAYFSVDGGTTSLASYGINSDPSDFLNSTAPNDPFDEFYSGSTFQNLTALDLTQLDVLGFNTSRPTCFLAGTSILTPTGEALIEDLKTGDFIVTASGENRPIKWLGHRPIDCTRYPDPEAVWPVCIKEGALGEGKPSRDLWVTCGHSFLFDDVLIQAEKLINGVTIVQQPRDRIDIWHIELDSHDIILAEGVPSESYLDTGNRADFINGGAFLRLHPDFQPKDWTETCVPLVFEGPKLIRAKTSILEVAAQNGHVITAESDLHIVADGKRVDPVWLTETRVAFMLQAGCSRISLRSRRFVPTHCQPTSHDDRTLGLAVGRLQIDGSDVAIDDNAALSAGWHDFEQHDNGRRLRWTDGATPLPADVRLIVIDIAGRGYYWSDRPDNVVPLFGERRDGARLGSA